MNKKRCFICFFLVFSLVFRVFSEAVPDITVSDMALRDDGKNAWLYVFVDTENITRGENDGEYILPVEIDAPQGFCALLFSVVLPDGCRAEKVSPCDLPDGAVLSSRTEGGNAHILIDSDENITEKVIVSLAFFADGTVSGAVEIISRGAISYIDGEESEVRVECVGGTLDFSQIGDENAGFSDAIFLGCRESDPIDGRYSVQILFLLLYIDTEDFFERAAVYPVKGSGELCLDEPSFTSNLDGSASYGADDFGGESFAVYTFHGIYADAEYVFLAEIGKCGYLIEYKKGAFSGIKEYQNKNFQESIVKLQ